MEKIGALWQKKKGDKVYFSGIVEYGDLKVSVVIFANGYKKDNQPDWNIYLSKPKEGETPTKPEQRDNKFDDDIPF